MPMSDQVDWKKLFPQEQQVPAGNPIADIGTAAAGGGALGFGGAGLLSLLLGEPIDALWLGAGAMGAAGAAGKAQERARRANEAANMWANRFGSGNPNQGLPGTPAGPAWRK